ncbi:MAG: DNA primase [Bacteriovoracaceae bacterium]|nr:DNA primase [Bacteriovoracaceae bacterium]
MSLGEVKELIKQTPISHIIGRYVSLTKRGTTFTALCPFHADKKPSLTVNDQKGLFMCFACQTGGDAITFVEKFKKVEFKEALLDIATFMGFSTDDLLGKKKDPRFDMAYRILNRAMENYRKEALSLKHPAYNDFLTNRNILPATAEKFSLGYAPHDNMMAKYLGRIPNPSEKKMALEIAQEIGIIRRDNNGKDFYDTFRDRIIFPIWDTYGQIVGFGSRAVFEHQKGKYINSQESFVFNKKNVLYGFSLAKESIRQKNEVILVEGYMDLITLHQHGITHAVAVMGVALGKKNIQMLKSYTKNILLALDSDDAGKKAMLRMNEDFMSEGILPRLVSFAPAKDPDEFLQKNGTVKDLQERFKNAPVMVDERISELIPVEPLASSDFKIALLEKIFSLLSPLGEDLMATERLILAAEKLDLKSDPAYIREKFLEHLKKEKKITPTSGNLQSNDLTHNEERADLEVSKKIPMLPPTKNEKIILREVILHPQSLSHPKFPELLDFVRHSEVKRVLRFTQNLYEEVGEAEYVQTLKNYMLRDELKLSFREIISKALFDYSTLEFDIKVLDKMISDWKKMLQLEKLGEEINQLQEEQKKCSSQEEATILMGKIMQARNNFFQIKNK